MIAGLLVGYLRSGVTRSKYGIFTQLCTVQISTIRFFSQQACVKQVPWPACVPNGNKIEPCIRHRQTIVYTSVLEKLLSCLHHFKYPVPRFQIRTDVLYGSPQRVTLKCHQPSRSQDGTWRWMPLSRVKSTSVTKKWYWKITFLLLVKIPAVRLYRQQAYIKWFSHPTCMPN